MHNYASQRCFHNAPIFLLLLKVAVNGTHQCDFLNFCGPLAATSREALKQTWTAGRRCFACFAKLLAHFSLCRDSSVGRASHRRSEGPRFDPGSRHCCYSPNWKIIPSPWSPHHSPALVHSASTEQEERRSLLQPRVEEAPRKVHDVGSKGMKYSPGHLLRDEGLRDIKTEHIKAGLP